jgi:hypothetical protein
MKRIISAIAATVTILLLIIITSGCKKSTNPLLDSGIFPDTVYNLQGLNTQYDDYNMDLPVFRSGSIAIFSSSRKTSGNKFDLVTGTIEFIFNRESGDFEVVGDMIDEPYHTALVNAANTEGDDFGPHRILSRHDSYEYLIITTESSTGDLDLKYLRYLPKLGTLIPDYGSLTSLNSINSSSDDGYISFDVSQNRIFFNSNREGTFNIYTTNKPEEMTLQQWFALDPVAVTKVDSINSDYNDKCPLLSRNTMVFASDRPGGLGGYDIYYSTFVNGKWSSPVNFGPGVNSAGNEYRPVLGYHPEFTNNFLIFSSDRPGGKGGYDLYFSGVTIPGTPSLITK